MKEAARIAQDPYSLLRATLESTADGILVVDQDGRIADYNHVFARLWKMPRTLLSSGNDEALLRFVLPQLKNPETFIAKVRYLYSHPEIESFDVIEFVDGRIFERYSRPQVINPGGRGQRIVGRVWSFRDVTRRERRREALRRSAKRLKALADSSRSLALARLDLPETLKEAARRSVELIGDGCIIRMVSEDRKRLEPAAFYHIDPKAREVMGALLKDTFTPMGEGLTGKVAETGKMEFIPRGSQQFAREILARIYWPYLEHFPIRSWICIPMRAGEKIIGVATLFRDVSGESYVEEDCAFAIELIERASLATENAELYQESQRAIQLREEFIAIASHELKTPLTPLKLQFQLVLKLLKNGALGGSPKAGELQALIESSDLQLNHLTRLIDDMLEGSREISGAFPLQTGRVDLSQIVSHVLARYEKEAVMAKCEIRFSAGGRVTGLWDEMRIEEVVLNLLTNALKYGAGKPVEIAVFARKGRAVLTVRDFGIGIAPEDQTRIFRRFERAVSYKHFGGMGLGLYISSAIVRAHGGSLSVESKPGDGSTFTMELPLES